MPAPISLSPEAFAAAFPFHLALDRELRIVQLGRALARVWATATPGSSLMAYAAVKRPLGVRTFEEMLARQGTLFLLDSLGGGLRLKGEMLAMDDGELLLFLGTPVVQSLSQLRDLGLSLSDFATHDPVVDFMALLQVKQTALNDARELASQLAARQEELVASNQNLRERESLLAQARDQALAASRLKSEFLSTISHELRTPMHGIIGMADLLLATALSAEQQEYADTVRSSATSLLTILNDILDLSKVEAGQLSLEIDDFDLHGVLDRVFDLMGEQAHAKGLRLTRSTGAEVPPRLRGDACRLQQVLLNLVGNAVKFTDHGEVAVEIEAQPGEGPEIELRFAVRDTGPGIALEMMERLFKPFSQADGSLARRYGGTGLGLAISKRLVELMGGAVGVESVAGAGSTFWFTARLARAASEGAGAAEPATGRIEGSAQPPVFEGDSGGYLKLGLRVLVAEDHPVNQRLAVLYLQKAGCSVVVVNNGREAIEAVCRPDLAYDLVLMDCQMPEVDGYSATRSIRAWEYEHGGHVPIIAVTASAMKGQRDECLAAGMDEYISKPVRITELHRLLARLRGERRNGAEAPARLGDLLDPRQLASLSDLLREEPGALAELVELYLDELQGAVDRLASAVEQRDFGRLANTAHKLKGASANLGASAIAETAARLEALGHAGELGAAGALIQHIQQLAGVLGSALESERPG